MTFFRDFVRSWPLVVLGRPVRNKTGRTGVYDLTLVECRQGLVIESAERPAEDEP